MVYCMLNATLQVSMEGRKKTVYGLTSRAGRSGPSQRREQAEDEFKVRRGRTEVGTSHRGGPDLEVM